MNFSFNVTISVKFMTLFPFIEIASAPAYLNSFTKFLRSSEEYLFSPTSFNVIMIPSPFTSVNPNNSFDF